jgi:ABC-2 type transport system ATP-binding protein
MQAESECVVAMDGLTKTYKNTHAVDGLTMRVPRGAVYGLLGRNGVGKSTTLRMAMGLARPTGGTLRVLGHDPTVDGERVKMLKRVGYVHEAKQLLDGATGAEMLRINAGFYPETWSQATAERYARDLELPLGTKFRALSLGNKTKLCLVLAMAQRPELLVLDEPTTGLDPVALDQVLRLLVEDFAAEGRTVLISTHQLREIEGVVDRVALMNNGRVVLEATLEGIRESYRRVVVAGQLPAWVAGEAEVLVAREERGGAEVLLRYGAEEFVARLEAGGSNVVSVGAVSLNELFLELNQPAAEEA